MPLARVGSDGVVRTWSVRAPLDWAIAVMNSGPLPMILFLSGGETVAENADSLIGIKAMLQGRGNLGWQDDPTFEAAAGTNPDPASWPKFVALFVDQPNPTKDVEDYGGQGFNSGSIGSGSAALWRLDDIGSIDEIMTLTRSEFDGAIARLTFNRAAGQITAAIDKDRIFACGHSDGGYMCVRLLQESTGSGRLVTSLNENLLRGGFCSGTGVGGILMNDQYGTRFTGSVGWNSVPYPSIVATPKVVMFVHGAAIEPMATYGKDLQLLGQANSQFTDLLDLNYTFQVENADVLAWNNPSQDAPSANAGGHAVNARMDHSVLASGNAWADPFDPGALTAFPAVGSAGGPAFSTLSWVDQYDRGVVGVDPWHVRVWDVEDMGHNWPHVTVDQDPLTGNFEGVVVAWLYFNEVAP